MEKEKITAGTIARTVALALALVNQILSALGLKIIPIENDTLSEFIAAAFTIVTAIIAWWKNNSFTQKAIKADSFLHSADILEEKPPDEDDPEMCDTGDNDEIPEDEDNVDD